MAISLNNNGLTLGNRTANKLIVGDSKVLGAPINMTWEEGMDTVESWGLGGFSKEPLPSIDVGEVNICKVTAPQAGNTIKHILLPSSGTYYWGWNRGSSPVPVTVQFITITTSKGENSDYLTDVSLKTVTTSGGTTITIHTGAGEDVYAIYYRVS